MNDQVDPEPQRDPHPADPLPSDAHEIALDEWRHGVLNSPRTARLVEWLQLGANVALAVIGVVAICIYGGELNVMKGQLSELVKQYPELQKSAEAAKSAADTADATLKSSKESFQIEQRPYVIAETPKFIEPWQKTTARSNITFRNIGHSPAFDAYELARLDKVSFKSRTQTSLILGIDNMFKRIAEEEREAEGPLGQELDKLDLAPQATTAYITKSLAEPTSDNDVSKIESGDTILVYIGAIQYKGGGDRKQLFETQFCFFFFGKEPIWHYCPTHNTIK
jgi:hypothetical protein